RRQRARALVAARPAEDAIGFQGTAGTFAGIPVADLNADQTQELHRTLLCLVEPFRKDDRDRVEECLRQQGGLERCGLALGEQGAVLEESTRPGGLCSTIEFEGAVFDWGGHSFHTPHPEVRELVFQALDMYEQPRRAYCWSQDTLIPYPFQAHFSELP